MAELNSQGFVVKGARGEVLADSHVSAYSRRVAVFRSSLEAVPGVDGLYVRCYTRDQVTSEQREHVFAAARTWYAARFGESKSVAAESSEAETVAEVVVEGSSEAEFGPERKPRTKRSAKPAGETGEVTP